MPRPRQLQQLVACFAFITLIKLLKAIDALKIVECPNNHKVVRLSKTMGVSDNEEAKAATVESNDDSKERKR